MLAVALPVGDAAQRRAHSAQLVFPDFFSGLGFQRDDSVLEGGRVENAAGHDGHGFGGGQRARGGV